MYTFSSKSTRREIDEFLTFILSKPKRRTQMTKRDQYNKYRWSANPDNDMSINI